MNLRNPMIVSVVLAVMLLFSGPAVVQAQEETDESWQSLQKESKRLKINEMADNALAELFTQSIKSEELYEKAYGWAAFDNLKIAFMFSGGGGQGVAIEKATGERTYMKMGTIGVGFGIGGQSYQVVFLFQDQGTFLHFVEKGWQADAGARAAAGTAGVSADTAFVNGLAIFTMNDKGLMANADVAGTKYWKNKKLNRGKK